MTKEEIKERMHELVIEYYKTCHQKEEYKKGDRINYSGRVYDEKELLNLMDSCMEFWLTNGKYTKEFETKLAAYLNVKYASFVNSGSSANLVAFSALTSPLLKDRQIKKGDEVICVACGFPTTIAPIIQNGCVPVFVDVTIPGYNMDVSKLNDALSSKTKAIFIAHTLGNPFDLSVIKEFCDKNNLWLIEDNCDALGSEYTYNGKTYKTGTIGDIGTSSFYPPHHITTGEGGAVYTNNPLLHKIMRSLRDWGRECICESGQDNRCNHRFTGQFGHLPYGYDHKYVYSHLGYNLKATDMQASIGCVQLDKVDDFTQKRRENYQLLYKLLKENNMDEYFILPTIADNANPSPFGFLLTCKENVSRNDVVSYLENNNIQTRMLFAGNIIKHPCFDHLRNTDAYRIVGTLENTDRIMNDTFWVGVYPGMNIEMIEYMAESIIESVKSKNRIKK